jgi:hypothetical protein
MGLRFRGNVQVASPQHRDPYGTGGEGDTARMERGSPPWVPGAKASSGHMFPSAEAMYGSADIASCDACPYTPLPTVTEDGCADVQHHSSKRRDRSWREAYPRRTDPETKQTLRIMICIMSAALNTTAAGARRSHVRERMRETIRIPYTINSPSQSSLSFDFTQNQVTKTCNVKDEAFN